MADFAGKRMVDIYSGRIDSPPNDVFPLLCPTREYDWLDGWTRDMIYCESGFAENNCIFKSDYGSGMEATWVTIRRDEKEFAFEFIIFFANLAVARMDIALDKNADGNTNLTWVRTMTDLCEDGNLMVDHIAGNPFRERMDWLVDSLNHYLKTGKMLIRN